MDNDKAFDALMKEAEQRVRDAALATDVETRNRLLAEASELAARAEALASGSASTNGSS